MITKLICWLTCVVTVISSCNEKDTTDPVTTIDVSKQWKFDNSGNVILALGDGQWQSKTFSTQELNLFSSLDTANLSGTTAPGSVLENPPFYNATFPNPFTSLHILPFKFNSGYSGQIVLKYVVADSTMTALFKAATKLNVSNASTNILFNPAISVGRFRLYYTLSSQSNPHFYKSWGNIQKIP